MSPIIMGPAHISPWRRTRRRRDACRRRRKDTWSRSRKLAAFIIGTNAALPDRPRSIVDSTTVASVYRSARSARVRFPLRFEAIVFPTAFADRAAATYHSLEVGGWDSGE